MTAYMGELQVIQALLQTGAAGVLILAGWYFMQFLKQERIDRGTERDNWRKDIHEINEAAQTERAEWRSTISTFGDRILTHDLLTAEAHKQAAASQERTSAVLDRLSHVVADLPCVSNGKVPNSQPPRPRSRPT